MDGGFGRLVTAPLFLSRNTRQQHVGARHNNDTPQNDARDVWVPWFIPRVIAYYIGNTIGTIAYNSGNALVWLIALVIAYTSIECVWNYVITREWLFTHGVLRRVEITTVVLKTIILYGIFNTVFVFIESLGSEWGATNTSRIGLLVISAIVVALAFDVLGVRTSV